MTDPELLLRLEHYLDAVPRRSALVEMFGPLTLFAKSGAGWPYYARPTLGDGSVTPAALAAVRDRQRQLGLPESVEWVAEVTPSMLPVAEQAGMSIQELPLMVLRQPMRRAVPVGIRVDLVGPEDPGLVLATAVAQVGFGTPGTDVGPSGERERDAAASEMTGEHLEFLRDRMRRGFTVTAAAVDEQLGPLCVGSHQPLGDVTEIVGVATLPSARRQGLAAAVTARLVDDAVDRRIPIVFLSAGSAAVARLYGRLGFERVGTSCIADAPAT